MTQEQTIQKLMFQSIMGAERDIEEMRELSLSVFSPSELTEKFGLMDVGELFSIILSKPRSSHGKPVRPRRH